MRRRSDQPNTLIALDKADIYTASFTDATGTIKEGIYGRIEVRGRPIWFAIPVDNMRVPPKWLENLMESAVSDEATPKEVSRDG